MTENNEREVTFALDSLRHRIENLNKEHAKEIESALEFAQSWIVRWAGWSLEDTKTKFEEFCRQKIMMSESKKHVYRAKQDAPKEHKPVIHSVWCYNANATRINWQCDCERRKGQRRVTQAKRWFLGHGGDCSDTDRRRRIKDRREGDV